MNDSAIASHFALAVAGSLSVTPSRYCGVVLNASARGRINSAGRFSTPPFSYLYIVARDTPSLSAKVSAFMPSSVRLILILSPTVMSIILSISIIYEHQNKCKRFSLKNEKIFLKTAKRLLTNQKNGCILITISNLRQRGGDKWLMLRR